MSHDSPDHRSSLRRLFDDLFGKKLDLSEEFDFRHRQLPPEEVKEARQQLLSHIEEEEQASTSRRRFLKYWSGVAATVVLLLIGSITYWVVSRDNTVQYTTGFGVTQEITLPDKSTVVLNANSTLRYHKEWKQGLREVWLEGEAYFSVVKDVNTPRKFLVHTEGLAVEVLGTTFNVNQRAKTTEVVLTSGRVKLNLDNPEQEKVLMQPGELVAYSSQTQRYVKQPIDTKIYTSWKDNLLIFKNQPLREIARTIEDRYGYVIRFDDPKIGEEHFTTTLPADQVDILFTMLTSSYDIHQEQSTITLYEKGKEP